MDRYETFRKFCQKIRETERSPRSLQAHWTLDFMKQFDEVKEKDLVFSE